MTSTINPLAFLELFIVLAFLCAWGILELVGRRLDRRASQVNDTNPPQLEQLTQASKVQMRGTDQQEDRRGC